MFENPRRGRQARNFTINVPKILDLKSSSEQIFSTQRGVKANHSILNFRIPFHQCKLPANVRNIIFIDMQYLPPVTQQCIVVCYESVRFQVDNFIVGLECVQDTSS